MCVTAISLQGRSFSKCVFIGLKWNEAMVNANYHYVFHKLLAHCTMASFFSGVRFWFSVLMLVLKRCETLLSTANPRWQFP